VLERLPTIAKAYTAASFISGLALALGTFLIVLFGRLIEQRWQDAAASVVLAPIIVGFFGLFTSLYVMVLPSCPPLSSSVWRKPSRFAQRPSTAARER